MSDTHPTVQCASCHDSTPEYEEVNRQKWCGRCLDEYGPKECANCREPLMIEGVAWVSGKPFCAFCAAINAEVCEVCQELIDSQEVYEISRGSTTWFVCNDDLRKWALLESISGALKEALK